MNVLQERIQDAFPSLPLSISSSMVQITRQLIGSPPDLHNIITLCDFLLLMHPAASTYVSHNTDNFYFAHKWSESHTLTC